MSEIDNAYKELRHLIAVRLDESLMAMGVKLTPVEVHTAAEGVMRLFGHVQDDWSRIDISTLGQGPGSNYLWHRDIVATVVGRPSVVAKRVDD